MTLRLANKIAIVTGAARGIGAAIVKAFAAAGAKVTAIDLPSKSNLIAANSNVFFVGCDVSDANDVDTAVEKSTRQMGLPNILVNNAGVSIPGGLEEMTEAEWDRTFAVNVKSIHLMGRRIIPLMRKNGGGSIINMASESAFIGFPMHPAYCSSKAAIVHLSRSMAVRYAADKIRVNALCPGTIDTEFYRDFIAKQDNPEATHKMVLAMHPLGLGQPEDIAMAAIYLASDESRYVTGAPMLVDGGATAQ